jgi:membrane protease subunit (stomatin/prohibitin family)
MGIVSFIKGGVRELAIARPDNAKNAIVYKHPDPTIPMLSQLTVYADECAVFFRDGKVVGIMEAGRHTLDSKNIPFLSNLVDSFTGGNVFRAEVFFVLKRMITDVRHGGRLAPIEDPYAMIMIQPRVNFSMNVRVADPGKFIADFVGTRHADNDTVLQTIKDEILLLFKDTIAELAMRQQQSLLQISADLVELTDELKKRSPTRLAVYGMEVVQIINPDVNFSAEDQKRMQDAIEEFRGAERKIRKAKAEAEARRAEIAVDLERDAAYAQMAGGFGQYAAAKAMIGAGEGMAKGGEGTSLAGMGAQMAAGVGMAQMMQQQQAAAMQAQQQAAAAAPAPAAPAAAAGLVACGACGKQVAPGKFCAECGATLAPKKKFCAQCGTEQAPGAKFCPECGTKA